LPGISFPCGNHEGLPLGVQLVGDSLKEAQLFQAAHQFQEVTDWHKKLPEVK